MGFFFEWFSWCFREFLRLLFRFFSSYWSVILIVAGCVFSTLTAVGSAVWWIVSLVLSIDFPSVDLSTPGPLLSCVAVTNTFFPLEEFFNYLIVYTTCAIVWAIYKLVKSWLPSLSGSG